MTIKIIQGNSFIKKNEERNNFRKEKEKIDLLKITKILLMVEERCR